MALHIGRWVSLALGAVLLAMVISVVVIDVATVDDLDPKVTGRLLITAAFSGLQFLAAHASRMQRIAPSN